MDRETVERARRGDKEAFAVLAQGMSDRLYAVALRILRDSDLAQDALQNAIVTSWRELPRLRDADRFEAWSHRLLINACYAESRRRKRWTALVHLDAVSTSTPDASTTVADRDELDRAFEHLSLDQRAVFVLHHYVGLSLVEVGETLGIPDGTARSRLHYATRVLREAFDSKGPGRALTEGRPA